MSRAFLSLMFVVLTGCAQLWQLDHVEGGRDAGASDGLDDASPDALVCYGSPTGLFKPCLGTPVQGDLALGGDIDTTTDSRCLIMDQPTGKAVCVIAAESIVVGAPVVAHGNNPLVLLASRSITISAPIDASSHDNKKGPGAQLACGNAGVGTDAMNGGGGGAGASFAYLGGGPAPGGGVTSTAHAPDPVELLVDVRGGCHGYRGGVSTTAGGTPTAGGQGGGALYMIAGQSIVATSGTITANGAAGHGGPVRGGGSGGGSGGLIGFDAPMVTIGVEMIARGGGGGSGGSDTNVGISGSEAFDPQNATPGGASATGSGSGPGWPGCGAPNGTVGGTNAAGTAAAGGGGGGGACGYILVYSGNKTISGMTNPAITP